MINLDRVLQKLPSFTLLCPGPECHMMASICYKLARLHIPGPGTDWTIRSARQHRFKTLRAKMRICGERWSFITHREGGPKGVCVRCSQFRPTAGQQRRRRMDHACRRKHRVRCGPPRREREWRLSAHHSMTWADQNTQD